MKKLIIANWKMNPKSLLEAESLWKKIIAVSKNSKNALVVVCPPFPFLPLGKKLKSKSVATGAQDVFRDPLGAHTGEVSASMLTSLGVRYVIIGHSDKRKEGDTNAIVNQKMITALKAKIEPILCIGESVRDDNGFYLGFIKNQIHECLAHIPKNQVKNIIIAYEPIWSISTNPNAIEDTPEDSMEMSIFIRKVLSDSLSPTVAKDIRIIYGGSINDKNAEGFLSRGGVSGVLVGGASLDPKKFNSIINSGGK